MSRIRLAATALVRASVAGLPSMNTLTRVLLAGSSLASVSTPTSRHGPQLREPFRSSSLGSSHTWKKPEMWAGTKADAFLINFPTHPDFLR
jgi:hypothetical protein